MHALAAWLEIGDVTRLVRVGFLVALRLAPLFAVAPFFGARVAPASVRAGLLVVLTAAFTQVAVGSASSFEAPAPWLVLVARELSIGMLFAFVATLPFAALDAGGRLVDSFRGAHASETSSTLASERTTPLGELATLLGLALFFATGAHRLAIFALAESFRVAPIGTTSFARSASSLEPLVSLFAWAMGLALSFAAPALVALLLGELALGVASRAAPQLATHFVGMPLRATLGLVALVLASSRIAAEFPEAVRHAMGGALRLLSGG